MYIIKKHLSEDYPRNEKQLLNLKGLLDSFTPISVQSANWKNWIALIDIKTCAKCLNNHGEIYALAEQPNKEPPLHDNCRCSIKIMNAVIPGNATKDGIMGADFWLASFGRLPGYYIGIDEIKSLGWRKGKSPVKYAPGKMISKGDYYNNNGHLPTAPGRRWLECDINYCEGKRNQHRILYSNDGLIFVTYDHYTTFYEIII